MLGLTFKRWYTHNSTRLGAAIACYAMFSLAPLLLLVIALATTFWGSQATPRLVHEMQVVVGPVAARSIASMLTQQYQFGNSLLTTVLGVITLIIGAGGVFSEVQDALNTMWDVVPDPDAGWKEMIRARLVSFGVMLLTAVMLLISLGASVIIAAATAFFQGLLPTPPWVLESANFIISFCVITVLLAFIYRLLPDIEIPWSDVWVGAALSAFLFTVGKGFLGMYLGRSSVTSAYGAAGSLVVLLLWVYYVAQILLFGAEFAAVYSRRHGSRVGVQTASPGSKGPSSQPPMSGAAQQERYSSH